MTSQTYGSPTAFRHALTDRLAHAADSSRWSLAELQRQFAYDRLLERLYHADDEWVVKGATALLARDLAVRATVDVDIYRAAASEAAEADLRAAATQDIGDWFRFELGSAMTRGDTGVRIPVIAYIGHAAWASFKVDLVGSDLRMTGTPEDVPPLADIKIPDVSQHGYRAYPLTDHIADKIVATFERYGPSEAPSTRYKDLIDLVAIVLGGTVSAKEQINALRAESLRRRVDLPKGFEVPDRQLWERGYAAEVRKSQLRGADSLDDALAIVRPFVDPLLAGTAKGRWDPSTQSWKPLR